MDKQFSLLYVWHFVECLTSSVSFQHHIRRNKQRLWCNTYAVPENNDNLEFFYVFWQWDQYHCLFQMQSDLFVRTPINQNPRYPKQIARSRFFPTHFAPLIQKPHCPTLTRKLRNGYIISILEKHKKYREDCPPMPLMATGLIPIFWIPP